MNKCSIAYSSNVRMFGQTTLSLLIRYGGLVRGKCVYWIDRPKSEVVEDAIFWYFDL